MNGVSPDSMLARVGRNSDVTAADLQGGGDRSPPPPDLPDRIAGQMQHEPTWTDFAKANPEAAARIDRGVGNAYGTDWHKRVIVAWNRDLPAVFDAIAAELAQRRAEAMVAWTAEVNGNG